MSDELMDEHYPGLKENPTMGNLINIGWCNFQRLMKTDAYKELRGGFQGGLNINSNSLINKQPFEEIENIYQQIFNKTGAVMNPFDQKSPKTIPDWFQDLTNNYLLLDMHGYHQDKIKVIEGGKKNTMRNIVDDGQHAAFASMCDIYVTNDNNALYKTSAVYKKLNIPTLIMSSVQFLNNYREEN